MSNDINVVVTNSNPINVKATQEVCVPIEIGTGENNISIDSQEGLNVGVQENNININLGEAIIKGESHKIEQFVATAGQTDFLLENEVKQNSQLVFLNGILQKTGDAYSLAIDTLIFNVGLIVGDEVEIKYVKV